MAARNGETDDRSKEGMRDFMSNFLPEDVVFAVLKASSCGTFNVKTKDEAIAEIIKWSDAVTMLNRQRVKKDYLLTYLIKKDVKASIKDTKTALCQAILKYWKCQGNLKTLQFPEMPQKPRILTAARARAPLKVVPSGQSTITNFLTSKEAKPKMDEIPKPEVSSTSTKEEAKPKKANELHTPPINSSKEPKKLKPDETATTCGKVATSSVSSSESNKPTEEEPTQKAGELTSTTPENSSCKTVALLTDNNARGDSTLHASHNKSIVATCEVGTNTEPSLLSLAAEEEDMAYELCITLRQKELELGQELGLEFSKWYYQRFNSMEDFIGAHFLNECNLRVEYITNNAIYNSKLTEFLHDGQRCFEEMCYLRTKKNLYLNPNLMSGVRGKMNPHGLAQILVCGTYHSPDAAGTQIGVFDQVFGLMRDPSCVGIENFKIKFTMLRLREDNHIVKGVDQPAIQDFSLDGIIEEMEDVEEGNMEAKEGVEVEEDRPGVGLD